MLLTIEAIAIDIRNEFKQTKMLKFYKENIGSGSLLLYTTESKCIFFLFRFLESIHV